MQLLAIGSRVVLILQSVPKASTVLSTAQQLLALFVTWLVVNAGV